MIRGMEQRIYRLARAGNIDTNPTTFIQRAALFASAATGKGAATLLTRREPSGLNGYLILPATSAGMNAEIHLAHTVGARVEAAALPEDLGDTPEIGTLAYRPSVAHAMTEGTWVPVTLRKPANREGKAVAFASIARRFGPDMVQKDVIAPERTLGHILLNSVSGSGPARTDGNYQSTDIFSSKVLNNNSGSWPLTM
jgi:hypothetical protein